MFSISVSCLFLSFSFPLSFLRSPTEDSRREPGGRNQWTGWREKGERERVVEEKFSTARVVLLNFLSRSLDPTITSSSLSLLLSSQRKAVQILTRLTHTSKERPLTLLNSLFRLLLPSVPSRNNFSSSFSNFYLIHFLFNYHTCPSLSSHVFSFSLLLPSLLSLFCFLHSFLSHTNSFQLECFNSKQPSQYNHSQFSLLSKRGEGLVLETDILITGR